MATVLIVCACLGIWALIGALNNPTPPTADSSRGLEDAVAFAVEGLCEVIEEICDDD